MHDAKQRLDEALKLLDELDTTPLSEISAKLDKITYAIVSARYAVILRDRAEAA